MMLYFYNLSIFLLFFILPIAGTNGLRYLLALMLLLMPLLTLYQNSHRIKKLNFKNEFFKILLFLFLLSVAIFIHTIFLSRDISYSLSEYRAHWLTPIIFFCVGLITVLNYRLRGYDFRNIVNSIFYGAFLNICFLFGGVIADFFLKNGNILYKNMGLTDSPVNLSYLVSYIILLLFAEVMARRYTSFKCLWGSNNLIYIFLIFSIIGVFLIGQRLGVLILVLILFISFSLILKKIRKKLISAISIFGISFFALIPLSLNIHSSWDGFTETFFVAIDTENYPTWKTRNMGDLPLKSNNEQHNSSNYERIAWFKKGLDYIVQYPEGYGFGRNIFGHIMEDEEGIDSVRGFHSHSGIIDLTLGIGVLGLIAWILFNLKIIRYFINTSNESHLFYSLFGYGYVFIFLFRSFGDSNIRDHMFQEFMLIISIFLTIFYFINSEYEKNSPNKRKQN